jgi:hypothetical protein
MRLAQMSEKKFSQVPHKLGDRGQIVYPEGFGDSELVSINMKYDLVELEFEVASQRDEENASPAKTIKIACSSPAFVKLNSDHLQNVVDEVLLIDRDVVPRDDIPVLSFVELNSILAENKTHRMLVLITPTLGICVAILCNHIRVFLSEDRSKWDEVSGALIH